jgi:hypothetical protein
MELRVHKADGHLELHFPGQRVAILVTSVYLTPNKWSLVAISHTAAKVFMNSQHTWILSLQPFDVEQKTFELFKAA